MTTVSTGVYLDSNPSKPELCYSTHCQSTSDNHFFVLRDTNFTKTDPYAEFGIYYDQYTKSYYSMHISLIHEQLIQKGFIHMTIYYAGILTDYGFHFDAICSDYFNITSGYRVDRTLNKSRVDCHIKNQDKDYMHYTSREHRDALLLMMQAYIMKNLSHRMHRMQGTEGGQRRGGGAAAHAPLQMIKCGKLKIDGREKTLFSSGEGQERYVKSYRIDVGGKKTLIYEKVNLCN